MPLLIKRATDTLQMVRVSRFNVHEVVLVPCLRTPLQDERDMMQLRDGDELLYHNVLITHGEFRVWDENRLSPSDNYPRDGND
jgi:hypothetical protein